MLRFYKGIILVKSWEWFRSHGFNCPKIWIDKHFKYLTFGTLVSCKEMTAEQLQELVAIALVECAAFGLEIDYPKDELDNKIQLNFNR